MSRLSRPPVIVGLLLVAASLLLLSRRSPFAGALVGTIVLVAVLWGLR